MNLHEPMMAVAMDGVSDAGYSIVPGSSLAVMQLTGPIYPDWNGAWFNAGARACAADPTAKAVCVVMNSPGGSVNGAGEMVAAMKALAASKDVYVAVPGMMCSLAYMAGCMAKEIAVTPMSLVGSIGTRGGVYFDTSKALETAGVKVHVAASSDNKALGLPGVPITDEMMQPERDLVASLNAEFIGIVAQARKMTPEAVMGLNAAVFSGRDAVTKGLADRVVESTDDYVRELAARYSTVQLMSTQPGRVPGNIAARAAGASLMSETTSTASAPAETAAASATTATNTVPAGPVAATAAALPQHIDDNAFCFDALTKGMTLTAALSEYVKQVKAAKPVAAAPVAAAPVETGARPSGAPEVQVAMTKANEYLEACRNGADPIAAGREMFKGMHTGAIEGKKRPQVFQSPEQQYGVSR